MIKLTGLWLNKSKTGEVFFSGSLGGGRIIVLKNQFKEEGSNDPDYTLYIEEQTKKQQKVEMEDIPF